MIDIKELIAARLRRDPAFRVVRDPKTGNYYLQNQVVFLYEGSKSTDDVTRLTSQYIDEANRIRKREGNPPLRLMILALSQNVVVVSGRGATELRGTGPTPPQPPPPPPWRLIDIQLDWVYVIQVLTDINRGHFDVISSSYASAAGISIGRDIEVIDK